jgi:hypothetical protein
VFEVTTLATKVKVPPTATVAEVVLSVTAVVGVVEALPLPQPATSRPSARRHPIFKVHRFIPRLHPKNLLIRSKPLSAFGEFI